MGWEAKDPVANLPYSIDWSDELNGLPIISSVWDIPTGITGSNQVNDGQSCAIWLAGGESGRDYWCENTITFMKDGVLSQNNRRALLPVRNK